MRFASYLKEEYYGTMKTGSKIYPGLNIYVNPGSGDLKDIVKSDIGWRHRGAHWVRLIADLEHQKLYVFVSDEIHEPVLHYLASQGAFKFDKTNAYNVWCDVGTIKDGKLYCDQFVALREYLDYVPKSIKKPTAQEVHQRFEWATKYIANRIEIMI